LIGWSTALKTLLRESEELYMKRTFSLDRDEGLVSEDHPDSNQEYADALQGLADEIRQSDQEPEALFVHVHYKDGSISRYKLLTEGFILMSAIGALECAKTELANLVVRGT
jgi:hypothetical protein